MEMDAKAAPSSGIFSTAWREQCQVASTGWANTATHDVSKKKPHIRKRTTMSPFGDRFKIANYYYFFGVGVFLRG
jgi:hypothetical protein